MTDDILCNIECYTGNNIEDVIEGDYDEYVLEVILKTMLHTTFKGNIEESIADDILHNNKGNIEGNVSQDIVHSNKGYIKESIAVHISKDMKDSISGNHVGNQQHQPPSLFELKFYLPSRSFFFLPSAFLLVL